LPWFIIYCCHANMAARIFERMHSSYTDCQWTVRECRGENAEPLIAHIVLAEFDIDTGMHITTL
jgi:hypothetical protein